SHRASETRPRHTTGRPKGAAMNAIPPARGRRVKFTSQAIEKIKELVAEGLSRDEIANRLGVTVGPLQVTCSRLELFSPNGSRRHTADIKSRSGASSR